MSTARQGALRLALTCMALAAAQAASAAVLTVHVVTPDGQPAADVVVEVQVPGAARRVPAEPVVITQLGLRFVPQVTAVTAGTTVRFTNQDGFEHHLRSQPAGPMGSIPPARQFEFKMSAARPEAPVFTEVVFDRAGLVVLGCHFHSAMRGHLYIGDSPWLAVTDASGKAVLQGLPEGRAEVRTWHPQQLVEQPVSAVPLSADTRLTAALNFRPAPPRQPKR
ncbi:MAG: hypothetical protein RJA10_513 [Pseudomonadota bacterium]|jgi:plastocyanin